MSSKFINFQIYKKNNNNFQKQVHSAQNKVLTHYCQENFAYFVLTLHLVSTSGNQFGFKKKLSSDMRIVMFKQVVVYYRNISTAVCVFFMLVKHLTK